jgi:hypothetical protein
MTIIDSHVHVNYEGSTLTKLIRYLDEEHIDYCWVLSWEEVNPGNWGYNHLPVEDIYDAFLKYPSRIIPFYAADPHRNDAPLQMEKWFQKGIRGYGELKATLNWDSQQMTPVLRKARELKMPIVFHMEESENRNIPYSNKIWDKVFFYGVKNENKIYRIPRNILLILEKHFAPLKQRQKSYFFPGYMLDFASLEATLLEYPEVKFVAHGQMFWKYISADGVDRKEMYPKGQIVGSGVIWRLLRDYPNLYADTSATSGFNALKRDAENAKRFLSLFQDKILYGTDGLMSGQREFFKSLGLSKKALDKIFGDNAKNIISLS